MSPGATGPTVSTAVPLLRKPSGRQKPRATSGVPETKGSPERNSDEQRQPFFEKTDNGTMRKERDATVKSKTLHGPPKCVGFRPGSVEYLMGEYADWNREPTFSGGPTTDCRHDNTEKQRNSDDDAVHRADAASYRAVDQIRQDRAQRDQPVIHLLVAEHQVHAEHTQDHEPKEHDLSDAASGNVDPLSGLTG